MAALKTCSEVLEYVRQTNLNFVFSESPFGVKISVKKSFRKDFVPLREVIENEVSDTADKTDILEDKLKKVTKENISKDGTINNLKVSVETLKKELNDALESLEGYRLNDKKLAKQLKEKDKEIHNMKRDFEKEKDKHEMLEMEVAELKIGLAHEKKEKIKLQKKDMRRNLNNNQQKDTSSQTGKFKCEECGDLCASEMELKCHVLANHKETCESFSQTLDECFSGGSQLKVKVEEFVQYH